MSLLSSNYYYWMEEWGANKTKYSFVNDHEVKMSCLQFAHRLFCFLLSKLQ